MSPVRSSHLPAKSLLGRPKPQLRFHPLVTAILVPLVPLLAAAIQSAWVFVDRPNHEYQALLHPHNYNPLWKILVTEVGITAAALVPLFRAAVLQLLVSLLLLGAFIYYAFSINNLVIR